MKKHILERRHTYVNRFQKLIQKLQSDPITIGNFLADPEEFLKSTKLTNQEKKTLLARDVEALNDLGLTIDQAVGALSGAHSQLCSTNHPTRG
ncbi:arginine deiminase [Lactobacillus delbrueckii]|uniref:arginine deiminase n=1 Tax=Lactobacillus delbrueckii TaxID=1584 RepID=UPI00128B44C1|nr:arginine deiminase [Lactobacillus delbrueckii]MPW12614.1 arginine deiminase [Lactobacillus delbrueckii]